MHGLLRILNGIALCVSAHLIPGACGLCHKPTGIPCQVSTQTGTQRVVLDFVGKYLRYNSQSNHNPPRRCRHPNPADSFDVLIDKPPLNSCRNGRLNTRPIAKSQLAFVTPGFKRIGGPSNGIAQTTTQLYGKSKRPKKQDFDESDIDYSDDEDAGDENAESKDEDDNLKDMTPALFVKYMRGEYLKPGTLLNERERDIQLHLDANKLYDKYGDWDKVHEELGIRTMKMTTETQACLIRDVFSLPVAPNNYLGKMTHELGLAKLYRKVKNFVEKINAAVERKFWPNKRADEFPRNKDYAFGIEPLTAGADVQPISEHALRGLMPDGCFQHLEEIARNNPERAQKILSVVHKIFRPLKLKLDLKRELTDIELMDDYDKVMRMRETCLQDFINTYPDQIWPSNELDYLNLYSQWFEPEASIHMNLAKTMKEAYVDSTDRKVGYIRPLVVNPGLSVVLGLTLGKCCELVTDRMFATNPSLMEFLHRNKGLYKYLLGGLSYLLLSEVEPKTEFAHEVIRALHGDVEVLERTGAAGLTQHVYTADATSQRALGPFDFLKSGAAKAYGGPLMPKAQSTGLTGAHEDTLRDVIGIRRRELVELAAEHKVGETDFRIGLDKAAFLLNLDSFLKLSEVCAYEKFWAPETFEERAKFNGKVDELEGLVEGLRYVNEVCLPLARTSPYRQIYILASKLANIGHLPLGEGGEVVGYYISGEDLLSNDELPNDDYSEFYKQAVEESGLPPENVPKNKYTALLFSAYALQLFGNTDDVCTATVPKDLASFKPTEEYLRRLRFPPDEVDWIMRTPMVASTLDKIEDWAQELERNGGLIRRDHIEYKYGIVTTDEFFGDSDEDRQKKRKYELEKLRDEFLKNFRNKHRLLEVAKACAMALHVTEDFILRELPTFWLEFTARMIYADLRTRDAPFDKYARAFNIADTAVNETKDRVMQIHFRHLRERIASQRTPGEGAKPTLDDDQPTMTEEELRTAFGSIKEMARKLELPSEKTHDYFRLFSYKELRRSLAKLDLAAVTKTQMQLFKATYESSDVVLLNALCDVVKERMAGLKKDLERSVKLDDSYLIQRNMGAILDAKRAVTRALHGLVDPKYMPRLDRAFRHNLPYAPKELSDDEILGRRRHFDTAEDAEPGDPTEEGFNDLRALDGDWELADNPDTMTEVERMLHEHNLREKEEAKPLEIYADQRDSPPRERREMREMYERGELPEGMKFFPTAFHLGKPKEDPEFAYDLKPPDHADYSRMPLILAEHMYKAWVIHNYAKRGASEDERKAFLAVFPETKR